MYDLPDIVFFIHVFNCFWHKRIIDGVSFDISCVQNICSNL